MVFNIRTRVILALATGIGLFGISLVVSIYQFIQISRSAVAVEAITEEVQLVSRLQLAVDKVLMPANDYLITGRSEESEEFNHLTSEVEDLLEKTKRLYIRDEEGHTLNNRIQESYKRLKTIGEEILNLSDPVRNIKGSLLMIQFDATGNEMILLANQYYFIYRHKLDQTRQEAASIRQKAIWHITGSGTVMVILVLVFGVRMTLSIIQSIKTLEKGTERTLALR